MQRRSGPERMERSRAEQSRRSCRDTSHRSTLEWGRVMAGTTMHCASVFQSEPPHSRCPPHSPLDGDFLHGTREDGVCCDRL